MKKLKFITIVYEIKDFFLCGGIPDFTDLLIYNRNYT